MGCHCTYRSWSIPETIRRPDGSQAGDEPASFTVQLQIQSSNHDWQWGRLVQECPGTDLAKVVATKLKRGVNDITKFFVMVASAAFKTVIKLDYIDSPAASNKVCLGWIWLLHVGAPSKNTVKHWYSIQFLKEVYIISEQQEGNINEALNIIYKDRKQYGTPETGMNGRETPEAKRTTSWWLEGLLWKQWSIVPTILYPLSLAKG